MKISGKVTPLCKMLTYIVDFTRVIDRKLKMGVADGVLSADGKDVFAVTKMKVGLAAQAT